MNCHPGSSIYTWSSAHKAGDRIHKVREKSKEIDYFFLEKAKWEKSLKKQKSICQKAGNEYTVTRGLVSLLSSGYPARHMIYVCSYICICVYIYIDGVFQRKP